jgi:hypothetical protein
VAKPSSTGRARILLGQLGSFGDCLYATAVARQIKEDRPDCRLTWAVGSIYASVLDGNPHVDDRWIVPVQGRSDLDNAWRRFEAEARRRLAASEFDEAYFTQLGPNNFQNFDGTVRASIFRGYPRPVTVPVTPVLRLSADETARVRSFAERHRLSDASRVVIFEFDPQSRQSFLDTRFAARAAARAADMVPGTVFVMSSARPFVSNDPRLIDGSTLTFRETPALTHFADMVVGCSSGVSWACTADCARPLPMIQFLARRTSVFASMAHDARRFGRDAEQVLELTECTPEYAAECIAAALSAGFPAARARFHEEIPVRLDMYFNVFMRSVLRQGQPMKVLRSMRTVYRRYGIAPFQRYLSEPFDRL